MACTMLEARVHIYVCVTLQMILLPILHNPIDILVNVTALYMRLVVCQDDRLLLPRKTCSNRL